ncbi:FliM/FliN family flagellar motor switch protein [Sphingomonas lenta]|uniref:Flagellar motor switch protein FliN-like C-terminal domain-containing protein n=1 Tax=Sphingomonas lenta TaxID=1141887 RepID=A0A2A2SCJ3_9SPHN|nr:FliM/FliN family flagellar motor switch protein [Sphingomonas lenta]PAX06979.1 hypothetical protein CKY28_13000 [Sphingomonas lenta]
MNAPFPPLRSRLRAVDARRAALQTSLIAALNRRLVDGLETRARLGAERDREGAPAWIRFRLGARGPAVALAPLLVDGAVARVANPAGEPDAAAAAAALARIEPLTAAVELALGGELHPVGLHGAADEPLLLRLGAGDPGGPDLHRVLLALPDDLEVAPLAPPPLAAGAGAALGLRWTASVPGPSVPLPALGRLEPGGLLVLGTGPLVAYVSLPGRRDRARARFDFQQGMMVLEQDVASQEAVAAAPGHGDPSWEEVRVATTVEIAGATLSAGDLATLGQGSVLPVETQGGTLAVRVRAGDRVVAHGELVAVGQGFGVLVTALAGEAGD